VVCCRPAPRGEPLRNVPGHPVNSVSTRIRPKRVKAGGSREQPSVMQLYESGVDDSKATGKWIALDCFREPPAFVSFPAALALRQELRGRRATRKSGSPPGCGQSHTTRTRRTFREQPGPNVASRSLRRRGEVGKTTTSTRTIGLAACNLYHWQKQRIPLQSYVLFQAITKVESNGVIQTRVQAFKRPELLSTSLR
jgi:hypothetical protein